MEKMTNVKALVAAIETLKAQDANPEVIAKLENIKASYAKKHAGEKKPTATQIANEALKAEIAAALKPGVKYTATDVTKLLEGEYSTQKITPILKALVATGTVERTEEKRKIYYSLVVA